MEKDNNVETKSTRLIPTGIKVIDFFSPHFKRWKDLEFFVSRSWKIISLTEIIHNIINQNPGDT